MTADRERVLSTLRALESWGDRRDWRGTDSYDALNTTRVPRRMLDTPLRRRLLIQLVKRSPVDLRPALGVPAAQNAVSLAWAASAYALGGFLAPAEAERRLARTLEALQRLRCASYAQPCWGYHFDFQSRVFFYPRTGPNTIATAYAGFALLDAHERTGDAALLEQAHAVARFFVRHVPQTPDPPGAYFGYLDGDSSPIHNANMHVCSLLARVATLTGDQRMWERARAGTKWTVARMRDDGSLPYGERPGLGWVDGFHTGYVLDALDACERAGIVEASDALQRGLEFYRRRMLRADGAPRYFAHRTYPIDMWCVAQAIQTLSIASRRDGALIADALRVFRFAHERMRTREGLFLYQRHRLWRNRACHVRGVVAPTVLALAHLLARLPAPADDREPPPRDLGPSAARAATGAPESARS